METNQFSIRPLNKYVLDVWPMTGTVAAIVSRMDLSSMELILWWGPLRKNQTQMSLIQMEEELQRKGTQFNKRI